MWKIENFVESEKIRVDDRNLYLKYCTFMDQMMDEYLRAGADINETVVLCGFFDQSHLHRHFKSMTTITPREYRVNFVQE